MLRSLIAGATVFAAVAVQGAAFSPITFSTSADYTNNFTNGTNFSYDANNQLLRFGAASGSSAGTHAVEYTPSAKFLTETLSFDTGFSAYGATLSTGVYTRVQSDHKGILGLINVATATATSASALQLRLFAGADTTSNSAGTSFIDKTITLPRGVAAGSPVHVTLTQTSANDPVFNLTVSDATGTLATTGDIAYKASDTYNTAGGIALRASAAATNGVSITYDNVAATATPEPAVLGVLGLGGLTLLRRRRA